MTTAPETTRRPAGDALAEQFHELVQAHTTSEIVGVDRITAQRPEPDPETRQALWNSLTGSDAGAPTSPPPPAAITVEALPSIEIDSGAIVFSNGVPVGGHAHLSLFPNGAFNFTGHFHVSGAPSYNVEYVFVVRSARGTVFTFSDTGRVHGTFESGSRNHDWQKSGTNPALAAAWADLSAGWSSRGNAAANIDIGALINSTIQAIGQVAQVIAVVA